MLLNAQNIIKILPFEEEFKIDLLKKLQGEDPDVRFNIERIVWKAYAALYDIKLQENIEIGLEEIKNGSQEMDQDFFRRVDELTQKQLEESSHEYLDKVDLSLARQKLENLMKEKN